MSEAHQIAFEAYGVPIVVGAGSPDVLRRIEEVLPPGWRRRDAAESDQHFALATADGADYVVRFEGGAVSGSSDLDVALDVLGVKLREYIALRAPELVFVHAGAVAHHGRAILVPGRSFSGKTTLVAELIRAGATYYSDEFAVLDQDGLVHPYAKPLSLRNGGLSQTDHDVTALGGIAGDEPVPVGLVVAGGYKPGAVWQPRRASLGEGVLALLANTVPAQERPAEALSAIRRAVEGAVILEGERGEAPIAQQLLDAVGD